MGPLYKKGLPIPIIQHIKQGRQNTKLRRKDNGTYGPPTANNVWVYQGYALSALLFVIYLDDVMQDCQPLNGEAKLPQRKTIQTATRTHNMNLLQYLESMNQGTPDNNNHEDIHTEKTQRPTYESLAREDEVIYADDTDVLAEHDATENMIARLLNYEQITKGIQVGIQWEKSK